MHHVEKKHPTVRVSTDSTSVDENHDDVSHMVYCSAKSLYTPPEEPPSAPRARPPRARPRGRPAPWCRRFAASLASRCLGVCLPLPGDEAAEDPPGEAPRASLDGSSKFFSISSFRNFRRAGTMQRLRRQLTVVGSSNPNRPAHYAWLTDALEMVASGSAHQVGCVDKATNSGFIPLFFAIGGCPNMFCGMQALVYCVSKKPPRKVDFWWVKPRQDNPAELELETLNRNASGPHRNDPGKSKRAYQPLATFLEEGACIGGWRFGVEELEGPDGGDPTARAFVEEEEEPEGGRQRRYLHVVWQEEFTQNPFASNKYIAGQIVYQEEPKVKRFGRIEFKLTDKTIHFIDAYHIDTETVLPGNEVKGLVQRGLA